MASILLPNSQLLHGTHTRAVGWLYDLYGDAPVVVLADLPEEKGCLLSFDMGTNNRCIRLHNRVLPPAGPAARNSLLAGCLIICLDRFLIRERLFLEHVLDREALVHAHELDRSIFQWRISNLIQFAWRMIGYVICVRDHQRHGARHPPLCTTPSNLFAPRHGTVSQPSVRAISAPSMATPIRMLPLLNESKRQ